MSASLLRLIKRTALEAVENSKPVNVTYGEVMSTTPLEIRLNQKLLLSSEHLVETQRLQGLSAGNKVVLLRLQGGQHYMVLDVMT